MKLASCKSALNPLVVYSTDRSKAAVPVLVLLSVALWFILRGDLLYVFPCVILFLCFLVLLVLRLPRLGKRELILSAFRTFVRFVLVWMSVSSSSWGLGRAAVCDCGTPWTFLLPYFGRRVFDSTKHRAHDLINITTDLRLVIYYSTIRYWSYRFLKSIHFLSCFGVIYLRLPQ